MSISMQHQLWTFLLETITAFPDNPYHIEHESFLTFFLVYMVYLLERLAYACAILFCAILLTATVTLMIMVFALGIFTVCLVAYRIWMITRRNMVRGTAIRRSKAWLCYGCRRISD